MPTRVKWYGDEFRKTLERNAVKIVNRAALLVQRESQRLLNQGASNRGATPSAPGQPPHKDTGTLARSITVDLAKVGKKPISSRVGTRLKYAAIHEFGGTIRPRTARALLVPIGPQGRQAIRSVPNVRQLRLNFIPRRGRPPLLARSLPRGRIQPLFVLPKSVRLPARPYMRPALANMRKQIRGLITRDALLEGYNR